MRINGPDIAVSEVQKQYSNKINQTVETDSKTKDFQNQIANAQNQLQKLSNNSEMNQDEKAEKRQEIQKKIMELNEKLREHKAEMRREKQQQAEETGEEELDDIKKQEKAASEEPVPSGISSRRMKAVISAGAAVDKVQTQENVSRKLENRVRILEGEIKQAEAGGGYVEAKKSELESLENKVTKISGTKANIINNAIEEMRDAVREEERERQMPGQGKDKTSQELAELPVKDFATKKHVDMYTKGKMFSNVDIHF